MLDKRIILD
jgi:hypothetical protein